MANATPTYSVMLRHLAPGAVAAGLAYPDEQLPAVSPGQLRELLYAFSELASRLTIYEPSTPEIRIKTDRESFVVRARYRGLCFVGYETTLRGEEHSVAYILTTITGTTETAKAPEPRLSERPASASPVGGGARPEVADPFPRWLKIAAMAVVIIACNGTAAWLFFRPPVTIAPKFTLMAPADSAALINRVAGEYRTGSQEGDRRIIIDTIGTARLAKFGPNLAPSQPATKTVRGAMIDGQPALVTNDPAAVVLKDADTLVLFGNTYKRHAP